MWKIWAWWCMLVIPMLGKQELTGQTAQSTYQLHTSERCLRIQVVSIWGMTFEVVLLPFHIWAPICICTQTYVCLYTHEEHIYRNFFSGWALWQEHTYLDFMPWVLFPYLKPGPQKSTSTMLGLGGGSIWTSWEIKTASPSSYHAVPWAVHVLLLARPPLPPGPGPRLLILRGVTGIEHTFRQLKALRQMSKHKTSDNSMREQKPALSRVMCQFKNKT